MTTQRTPKHVLSYCLALAMPAMALMAQQAAPSSTTAPTKQDTPSTEEEILTLSPFVISAEEDANSYQANSTLAGTRVRTELKDVGSAISVVTLKMMQDIGATNTETLLKYTVGTEVGGVGGNFTGVGNGREVYENDRLLRPNTNTRVRGLTRADNTRDFFLTDIPWDGYNIGRVDIQRGPNAILFGMGSPAGIINNSTNGASYKTEGKFELRVDSNHGNRASFDINQVVLKNELAFRLAGVSDQAKYRQKPAFNRDDRIFAATKYEPSFLKRNGMLTSFRANFEKGDIVGNRARSLTPVDLVTPWFTDMGKKTYDPIVAWRGDVNNPNSNQRNYLNADGTLNPAYVIMGGHGNIYGNPVAIFGAGNSTPNQVRMYDSNGNWGISKDTAVSAGNLAKAKANNYYGLGEMGSLGAWDGGIGGIPFSAMVGVAGYSGRMNSIVTGAKNPDGTYIIGSEFTHLDAYKDKTLNDPGVYDYYNNLLDGPNKRELRGFEAYNLALSQSFLNNRLALDATYDSQRYHDSQWGSVRQVLAVDINTRTLDGSLNPNVGKAFTQSDSSGSEYHTDRKAKRFTGTGEFRATDIFDRSLLTDILGQHIFTGMYAGETLNTKSLSFVEYGLDSAFAYEIGGMTPDQQRLDSSTRKLIKVSYLSDSLSGVANASAAHIQPITVVQEPDAAMGSIFRFDSHWNKPANPNDPNFVNPAALWTPPSTSDGSTESDNPANYKGWGNYALGKFSSYNKGDRLYNNGQAYYHTIKSQAFVWQGHLLQNTLVPMIGWRRDVFKQGNKDAIRGNLNIVNPNDPDWAIPTISDAEESISYSLVAHSPKFIKKFLPEGTSVSLYYNRSQNFQPGAGSVDMFGKTIANPDGKTTDYSIAVSVLDERLSLKVTSFTTKVQNDRLQGFQFWKINQFAQTILSSAYRLNHKDAANSWKWDYGTKWGGSDPANQAKEQAKADAGAALLVSSYDTNPIYKQFVDGWQLKGYFTNEYASSNMPAGLAATTDSMSKGLEFELNGKILPNWNLAINAAKTHATQNNIGGALKSWIEAMTPIANGAAGDLRQWWAGDSNNFRTIWARDILSQFKLLKLLEGTDVPELRPWRYNVVSNYDFQKGLLKGVNAGLGYRWEQGQVIGFPIKTTPAVGNTPAEYNYDVTKPYIGPSDSHLDLWVGYGHKLTKKINWRVQLNVRDLLATKKLVSVSAEPDGSTAAYRIPDLTSWSLTNTFSF